VSLRHTYKPVSLVMLGDGRLGLRLTAKAGERMTIPLVPATVAMLFPKPR
jgi:hypothetical protein